MKHAHHVKILSFWTEEPENNLRRFQDDCSADRIYSSKSTNVCHIVGYATSLKAEWFSDFFKGGVSFIEIKSSKCW